MQVSTAAGTLLNELGTGFPTDEIMQSWGLVYPHFCDKSPSTASAKSMLKRSARISRRLFAWPQRPIFKFLLPSAALPILLRQVKNWQGNQAARRIGVAVLVVGSSHKQN
eukprot:gene24643-10266_t